MKAQRTISVILALSAAFLTAASFDVLAQDRPGAPKAEDGGVDEKDYGKDANTEINVKNADIAALVRIFSRKTKRNYILDEKVRGKVSSSSATLAEALAGLMFATTLLKTAAGEGAVAAAELVGRVPALAAR